MTPSDPRSGAAGGGQGGRHTVGVLVRLTVTAVVLGLLVLGVRAERGLGYEPAADPATTGAQVRLSVYPDSMVCHGGAGGPHSDWVTYCPSTSLRLLAHRTVTVTIRQYDSAASLHNPFFDKVRGTIGDTMTVNGRAVSQLPPAVVGHTFTIQTPPNTSEPQMFVSVPLPGTPDNADQSATTVAGNPYPKPDVITFQIRTGAPGTYVWHCYAPCGTGLAGDGTGGQDNFGGPMSTIGYMSGTVTVA